MVCIADKSKISVFNYFYLLCIIIYAGGATIFARSMSTPFTVGNTVALLLTAIFISTNHIKFNKSLGIAIVLFSLYAIFTFIQNRHISSMWLSMWWINILISYVICTCFKTKLFAAFETIIYHLCIISLIFWGVYLVAPEILKSIFNILQFSSSYSTDIQSKNIIVYTLMEDDRLLNDFVTLPRNAGFAWEPGAFSCFICLAIFCNIIRTNFKLKKNFSLLILLITLFTTSSTTGYFILIAISLSWMICSRKYLHILYIIPIAIILFQQPFVKDKIFEEYGNAEYVNIAMFDDNTNVALGRIASLQLDWDEFMRHPMLGLGGYSEGTWLMKRGYDNIATISGIGKLLSRYGIILTFIFLIFLIKSAKRINQIYKTTNGWLIIIVIIGMMISYNLWTHPIFMMFWMFGIWNKPTYKPSCKIS